MDQPIILERTFRISPAKVWSALTQNEEMKQWYFKLADFKAEVGFEFEFLGGPDAGIQYRHLCRVIDVIPEKKLSYSWRYDGYEGDSIVTFELFDEAGMTRLRLTHEGLHSFPVSNPDFAKKNFVEGWTHILHTSLKNYLEK